MIVDGAFSSSFEATAGLLAALGWALVLVTSVVLLLRRAVEPRE